MAVSSEAELDLSRFTLGFLHNFLTRSMVFQGINRLGKAPPRPGSLRPPDPNRNRVLDIYSEGTEGDADYMRMVQDVSPTPPKRLTRHIESALCMKIVRKWDLTVCAEPHGWVDEALTVYI